MEPPFIKMTADAQGGIQIQTNIADMAQVNIWLDIAKVSLVNALMKPKTLVQPVGASALPAMNGDPSTNKH